MYIIFNIKEIFRGSWLLTNARIPEIAREYSQGTHPRWEATIGKLTKPIRQIVKRP